MDITIGLLVEILEKVNNNCIYIGTDYMGFFDKEFCDKIKLNYIYKKYGKLTIPLNLINKEKFIKYLFKMSEYYDTLIFQENHIYCNEKQILKSYDNFKGGTFISKSLNINIEKYKTAGIIIKIE